MSLSPTALGAISSWEPFRQLTGDRGVIDWVDDNPAVLGGQDEAFIARGYLRLPGTASNNCTTPDSAALTVSTEVDVRLKFAPPDWTPSGLRELVGKFNSGSSQKSIRWQLDPSGVLNLSLSVNGSSEATTASSVAVTGVTDGVARWVRFTWRASDGRVQFFQSGDGSSWTQIGIDRTVAIAGIFDSNTPWEIGSVNGGGAGSLTGKIYQAEIRSVIDGTTIASPNFETATPAALFVTDTQGNIWNVNSSAADSSDPTFAAGGLVTVTNDYAKVYYATNMALGAAGTVMCVAKLVASANKCLASHFDTGAGKRCWWIGTDATGAKLRVKISADGGATNFKDYTSSVTAYDNTFHTVTFTFGSSTLKLYIDGVEDTSLTLTTDAAVASLFDPTPINALFGASFNSSTPVEQIDATIAAVTLLPTALSSTNVDNLHDWFVEQCAAVGVFIAGPAPGVVTFSTATAATITMISAAAVSGGVAPYTYQWYRSTTANFIAGAGNILSGQTSLTCADSAGLVAGTTYYYKVIVTDSAAATATSLSAAGRLYNTPTPIRIGYIGTSLGATIGSGGLGTAPQACGRRLEEWSRELHTVTMTNAAASGTSTSDWQPGSALLVAAKAAFASAGVTHVIIEHGTNDSVNDRTKATFKSNLSAICNDLVSAGYKVVMIDSPYFVPGCFPNRTETRLALLPQYEEAKSELDNGSTIFYRTAGLYAFSATHTTLMSDGLHPTALGVEAWGYLQAVAMSDDVGGIEISGGVGADATVYGGLRGIACV